MRNVGIGIAAVIAVSCASAPATAGEWVFHPIEQSARVTDDHLQTQAELATAQCDYEIKPLIVMRHLDREDGFALFAACIRSKGFHLYTPQQHRSAADAWNATHPGQKARGVLFTFND
ncbi:hypothetical protein XI03_26165 [Bradyrhizobium sp. CCBAU 65884]|nr:hypothetical protein [Bradyrhizobium sp. CCBAU 65884]